MAQNIPVIDLHGIALDAVRAGIEEIGLVQVVNHGIDAGLIDEFSRRTGELLSRPRAEKAKLASPTGHPYRGWRQWPDDFGRLELERYMIAQFDNPQDAHAAGVPDEHLALFAHENVWPDAQLREVMLGYLNACQHLAERMLELYARAEQVPADTFSLGSIPHVRLTVNDYPTWAYPEDDDAPEADKLLLLEHADDSAITILSQDGDYEGLQAQLSDGSWQTVPVIPGALQVLSGKLLTRWTNGRLRPGRHRVIAGGTDTRRSTAVFCYPSLETTVRPLDPFVGPEGATEPPVLVWDHVSKRVQEYLEEYGRPEQIAAWREGKPYVAPLADTSAGR